MWQFQMSLWLKKLRPQTQTPIELCSWTVIRRGLHDVDILSQFLYWFQHVLLAV